MRITLPIIAAIVFSASSFTGCSDDATLMDGSDKPCGVGTGLYANITGGAEPVAMCVPDDRIQGTIDTGVHTNYSSQSERYLISAVYTENNTTHEIDISFTAHLELPAVLIVTANVAQADSDSDYVWMFYQMTESGGTTWSTESASGTITLTFNSPETIVATFNSIELQLTDTPGQSPSMIRAFSEGYINLSTDPL